MANFNLDNSSNSNELINFWRNNEYIKPNVIIFDLDFTLWPYFANRYYQTPFKIHKNSLIDSKNKKVTYFNDVPNILKTLKEECFKSGEKLAIASRSGDRKTVESLLEFS
jgi:magnesium-dependent phosphatase-1